MEIEDTKEEEQKFLTNELHRSVLMDQPEIPVLVEYSVLKALARHICRIGPCKEKYILESSVVKQKKKRKRGEISRKLISSIERPIKRISLKEISGRWPRERKFTCEICNKKFQTLNNLTTHIRTHTGEKPYSCKVCFKSFTQKCSVINHFKTHLEEKPYTCFVCNRSFRLANALLVHERVHTGEKPFPCHLCPKAYAHAKNLKQHLMTFHGEESCPPRSNYKEVCTLIKIKEEAKNPYSQEGAVVNYDNINMTAVENVDVSRGGHGFYALGADYTDVPEMEFDLPLSEPENNQYSSDEAEDNIGVENIMNKQPNIPELVENKPGAQEKLDQALNIKIWPSRRRLASSYSKSHLKLNIHVEKYNHLDSVVDNKVREDKMFVCHHCEKIFLRRNQIVDHMKLHMEEKFFCALCPRGYKKKDSLRIHLQTHMTLKRIPCQYCDVTFKFPSGLERHMNMHLNIRNYKCDLCEKTFVDSSSLGKHRDTHLGVRYKCDVCGKQYSAQQTLRNHLAKHLGLDKPKQDTVFACDLCPQTLTSKHLLMIHRNKVHLSVSYACDICSKTFSGKNNLRVHKKVHTSKLKCTICDAQYNSREGMLVHMNKHMDITYPCLMCSKVYYLDRHLTDHVLRIHNNPVSGDSD